LSKTLGDVFESRALEFLQRQRIHPPIDYDFDPRLLGR